MYIHIYIYIYIYTYHVSPRLLLISGPPIPFRSKSIPLYQWYIYIPNLYHQKYISNSTSYSLLVQYILCL